MGIDGWLWVAFGVVIVGFLALDLGLLQRRLGPPTLRQAATFTGVWVALALAFCAAIFVWRGHEAGLQFLTGYLIEYSLSVDNIFVWLLIFTYFGVPLRYQRLLLFWGVIDALVLRGIMIAVGAVLIRQFHWVIYVFGAFLIVTGVRMALDKGAEVDPEHNPLLRLVRRLVPITSGYRDGRFFVREAGRLLATPFVVVILMIETTDLMFAVDSIPAIFAITVDPFIVYTSNMFAILGLRSLYFLLAGVIHRFHYLSLGLSIVLAFIGVKMLLSDLVDIPTALSLAVVVGVLAVAVVASLLRPPPSTELAEELSEIAARRERGHTS